MDSESSMLVDNEVSVEMDDDVVVETQQQPCRRRKRKSIIWDHFTLEAISSETTKAVCKHCKKSYAYKTGAKFSGTSHLKRHIEMGICPMITNQLPQIMGVTTPPKKRQRLSSNGGGGLDQDRCNREMAKMIIMHDYPLDMVEHSGFAGFVRTLRPQFSMASFETIHGDCVDMFLSQKQKLLELIGEIPGGVNLTLDLWSSKQSVGYAFVTGHFVDKDWNLTRWLLNVAVVASPDSEFALNQPVAACLHNWNLEGKISGITVGSSLVNKTAIDNLRGFLSARNQYVLNGKLLMGKCYSRLLSGMAQEALTAEQFQGPIKKVRDSIKYVKASETCGDRFDELKRQFPISNPYKDILIDNQMRWDTSYNMSLAACQHKQVFSSLGSCHPDYKILISPEEWRKIESLCSCLSLLYEASNVLTGTNSVTANVLYHEMTNLQRGLNTMSEDPDVGNLVNSLMEKFNEYWGGCYLRLAVAVVLDPRNKMEYIKTNFTESYGENAEKWIKTVDDAVRDLYLNYSEENLLNAFVDHDFSESEVAQDPHFHQEMPQDANTGNEQSGEKTSPHVEETSPPVEETTESNQHERQVKEEKKDVEETWERVSEESQVTEVGDDPQAHKIAEEDHMFSTDDVLLEEGSIIIKIGDPLMSELDIELAFPLIKPELDRYLEETLEPMKQDFNVLSWWGAKSTKDYPILSKIALDLLSFPYCTVSPDCVFETEVKQMDNYKTSLPRATLEALLCTKDWLKNGTL